MVGVIMRGQRANNLHTVGVSDLNQVTHVVGRINNDGLAGLRVANEITEVAHLAGDLIVLGKVSP